MFRNDPPEEIRFIRGINSVLKQDACANARVPGGLGSVKKKKKTDMRLRIMHVPSRTKLTVRASRQLGVPPQTVRKTIETISHEALHAADGSGNYRRR